MQLRRLWLLFAQATTVGLGLLFVVSTLRPQWLGRYSVAADQPAPAAAHAAAVATAATSAATGVRQVPISDVAPRVSAIGSYSDAARLAMPAVVSVYTSKQVKRSGPSDDPLLRQFFADPSGEPQRVISLGSGVIASPDGYILTNNHVVQAGDEIAVALTDGRRVPAHLVGADPDTDLAVLKVELQNLPAITFGRSETLRVGDVVLAIGNPFDVGQTVTMGIVSALGRTNLGINTLENFIQTDAAINQGNSGGALIDSNGLLIGINTAIFSRSGGSVGIGFAIPTSIVTHVMDQIVHTGRVHHGFFGIEPYDITPELVDAMRLKRSDGVVVNGVLRNAPAGRAGMEPGDILLSINGSAVTDSRSMLNQIAQLEPGTSAAVRVLREAHEVDLSITVGERPPPPH
ncbi:MAG TPA: trypsin-like peptidase domain-containing protein [Burkholderiaceae bacterium]|jgi:serine protease DegQ|nr:trypsin-like peptidase domain-containing protein [Burkholderiaceae bacterium]